MMTRTLLFALLATSFVEAGDLTWDTVSGDGSAITHGGGTWNFPNALWNNGSGNVGWTNSTPRTNAVFAGNTSGVTTVTIGTDPLQAGTITVNGAGGTMVLNGAYANLSADLLEVRTSAAGKLAINASGTLANVAAIAIANGASVYIANATVNSSVTVTGQGNSENLGAIRVDSGTLQGSVNLLGNSTFGANSGTGTIAAAVSGDFAFNRSSAGNGTVRLTANNSHSGGTTISRAVVQAGHNNAFGTGTLTLSGGTLSSDSTTARTFANAVALGPAITLGHATQSGKLTFAGPATTSSTATLTAASAVEFAEIRAGGGIQRAGTGTFTLGRFTALGNAAGLAGEPITLPAAGAVIDTAGFDAIVSAKLSGGPLVKSGAGILTLEQSPPDFTGITTVAQGTLHLKGQTGLASNLKIMPLGDSITVGASTSGYRFLLHQHLLPMAPGFQFIGDSTASPGSLPAGYQNHSGHSSYSTDDIRNNLDSLDFTTFSTYGSDARDPRGGHWLTGLASPLTYTVPNQGTFTYGPRDPLHPDLILLLVGANDVFRAGSTNGDHRANYTAMLNEIYRLRPAVHVFAAKITPHKTTDAPAVAFNTIVEEVVADFQAAGKAITLVDLHTGYTGSFTDNLHPDAAGYAWIAGKWRDALIATLSTELPLSLRSSPAVQVAAGATLSGNALVNHLAVDGILAPGAAQIGTINASSATLRGTLRLDFDSRTARSDLLVVNGDIDADLDGALMIGDLAGVNGEILPPATKIALIEYTGTLNGLLDINGAADVPDGAVITIGANRFILAYADTTDGVKSGKFVTLTVPETPPVGYVAWAAANADGQAPDQDFDMDGMPNSVEYFMGATGSTFTANPPVVTTGGLRTVTWPRDPLAAATFAVQTSTSLANASWTTMTPPHAAIDTSNPNFVVFTLPDGDPALFVRLAVTIHP